MTLMDLMKRWMEAHTPDIPWSDTLWRSHSPAVRETALDRTYARLDEHERELRETVGRLEAELGAFSPPGNHADEGHEGHGDAA